MTKKVLLLNVQSTTRLDFFFKDSILLKNSSKNKYKFFSKKFDQIYLNLKSNIKNFKKTENVLNDNFETRLFVDFGP